MPQPRNSSPTAGSPSDSTRKWLRSGSSWPCGAPSTHSPAVAAALDRARPHAEAAVSRAAGSVFWELGDGELSVLGEPGTVGALLRTIREDGGACSGPVLAALHHRHPALVPHLTTTTRRALLPHTEEGDSGVEAVVRRRTSLLPVGITGVEGRFTAGDTVDLCDGAGHVVARGLAGYDAEELRPLVGRRLERAGRLRTGAPAPRPVVRRDDLVVLTPGTFPIP